MVNSRNKGWRGEHEIAQLLEKRHGTPATRGDGSLGTHDLDWEEWKVEVKFTETGHGFTYKWTEQNNADFVVHRKKNAIWLATLPLDTLLDIIDR